MIMSYNLNADFKYLGTYTPTTEWKQPRKWRGSKGELKKQCCTLGDHDVIIISIHTENGACELESHLFALYSMSGNYAFVLHLDKEWHTTS